MPGCAQACGAGLLDLATAIAADRENAKYLPGHRLPGELQVATDLAGAADSDLLILATPAQATRDVVTKLSGHISQAGAADHHGKGA